MHRKLRISTTSSQTSTQRSTGEMWVISDSPRAKKSPWTATRRRIFMLQRTHSACRQTQCSWLSSVSPTPKAGLAHTRAAYTVLYRGAMLLSRRALERIGTCSEEILHVIGRSQLSCQDGPRSSRCCGLEATEWNENEQPKDDVNENPDPPSKRSPLPLKWPCGNA